METKLFLLEVEEAVLGMVPSPTVNLGGNGGCGGGSGTNDTGNSGDGDDPPFTSDGGNGAPVLRFKEKTEDSVVLMQMEVVAVEVVLQPQVVQVVLHLLLLEAEMVATELHLQLLVLR